MFKIFSDCPKQSLKYNIFVNIKKAKKWPNGQTIFSGKQFLKRPKGNPGVEGEGGRK